MKNIQAFLSTLSEEKKPEKEAKEIRDDVPLSAGEFFEVLIQRIAQLYNAKPKELPFFVPQEQLSLTKKFVESQITKELIMEAITKDINFMRYLLEKLSKHDPKLRVVLEKLSVFLKRPLFLTDVIKP